MFTCLTICDTDRTHQKSFQTISSYKGFPCLEPIRLEYVYYGWLPSCSPWLPHFLWSHGQHPLAGKYESGRLYFKNRRELLSPVSHIGGYCVVCLLSVGDKLKNRRSHLVKTSQWLAMFSSIRQNVRLIRKEAISLQKIIFKSSMYNIVHNQQRGNVSVASA